jgi:hypothetical protein
MRSDLFQHIPAVCFTDESLFWQNAILLHLVLLFSSIGLSGFPNYQMLDRRNFALLFLSHPDSIWGSGKLDAFSTSAGDVSGCHGLFSNPHPPKETSPYIH